MSKALDIWRVLDEAWEAHEPVPTIRELVAQLGLSSTSVATFHLEKLARAGIIEWQPGKARTIRLLKRYEHENNML